MATVTTVLCPACGLPREAGQAVCGGCGRVFDMAALQAGPTAAPDEHFAPGQSLSGGRYRVLRPLSSGGMGALYLATDQEAFGRTVVVKTLLTRLDAMAPAEAQTALRHFVQEARTLAGLRYPTIPQIYSYFHDGPLACMVMEYIEGDDLSHGLSRPGPQGGAPVAGEAYPLAEVLAWAVSLCRTLEYLAVQQPPVIHQDIKPANLIRDAHSGQLYLVDFGAARAIAPASPGPGTAIFGTPGYAAPEQYRGECSPASDVYALAATLYHLATDDDPGDHPFAFPQMKRLGYLGRVLQGALESDPAQRPSATVMRRSVEVLLAPDAARFITAPDGATLQGEVELARWCERHWEQARAWLYGDMPGAVERELVQIAMAAQLRGCVAHHANNHNAGLDEAIARLDPKGFGASEALLQLSPPSIDLGRFDANTPVRTQLRVHNAGRRYVRATLTTPAWLAAAASETLARKETLAVRGAATPPTLALDLQPGQEIALFLAPIPNRYTGVADSGAIELRADRQVAAKVPVSGTSTPVHQPPAVRSVSSSQWNDAMMLLFVLLSIMIFAVVMTVIFH
ncbi:serine/threonine protein kinase [Oscillochloris sp. ZM17-4]|uniref:serine/threonine protein kinase n=1 Tax=Oscillochloris sp. ZM17-4 TaxID=2866714 RepID=UPI001C72FA11|nr:serine/threonine-protein kinase [Oscillochloris sp. ZM17-4]MBX0330894.1 serine/threonine protein kinase [Oscillochloris sp. ZM17-4]